MLNATKTHVTDVTIPSELDEVGGTKNLHGVISEAGASYDFKFHSAVIVPNEEKGNVIRISHLSMEMEHARVAENDEEGEEPTSRSAVIKADIDVR
jgi:hypothetical protein